MIFLSFFRRQASNQSKTMTILDGKKVPFEKVDGMDPEQRDRRNELFNISGIRGNYPQFFFVDKNGKTEFFGDYEKFEIINDSSSYPADVLEANPDIETWEKVFGKVVESFS
uniref:Uncharacterized protein n=1 Tax=Ditylum brightwellii TaxID=49249 RepID=A0A6S9DD94_9STRA|mmetsp:Transcript_19661/g.28497  ORF Transcript_19661/g.28497 Transcript_19661/m.28497 type:complete len:112 (-) Transcript_19661:354-689(-)